MHGGGECRLGGLGVDPPQRCQWVPRASPSPRRSIVLQTHPQHSQTSPAAPAAELCHGQAAILARLSRQPDTNWGQASLSPAPCPPLSLLTCRRRRSFGNPPAMGWFSAGKRQPGGKGQSWWGTGHGATGATVTSPGGRAPALCKGSPGPAQLGTRWMTCGRRPCHGETSVTATHGRDSVEGGPPRP